MGDAHNAMGRPTAALSALSSKDGCLGHPTAIITDQLEQAVVMQLSQQASRARPALPWLLVTGFGLFRSPMLPPLFIGCKWMMLRP
jgi:hypothetical protein